VVGAFSYMLFSHLDFLLNGGHGLKMCDLIVAAGLAVVSFRWWRHSARASLSGTKMAQPSICRHRFVSAANTKDFGQLERSSYLRTGPNYKQGGTNFSSLNTGIDDDDDDDRDVDDVHDDGNPSNTPEQRMFRKNVKKVIIACRDAEFEVAERLLVQLATPVHNVERKDAGQTAVQSMAHAIVEACLQAGDVHRAARWVELMHKGGMPLHPRSIHYVLGILIQRSKFRRAVMFLFDLAVAGAPADLACFDRVLEHCISLDGPTGLEEWLEQVTRCGTRAASLAYTALICSPRHVSTVAHAEYWFDHACKARIPVSGQLLGAVMCACGRAGEDHATERWFQKLLKFTKDCKSADEQMLSFDTPVFRKLIDAFSQQGDIKRAQEWFTKVVSEEIIQPDANALGNVIRGQLRRGDLTVAEQWLQYARKHKFVLDVSDFNSAMIYAVRSEKPEAAEKWLHRMALDGIKPDIVSYNSIIQAWSKKGNSNRIEVLINKMCEDGVEPELGTLTSAMHAFAKGAEATRAEALFNQIVSRGHVQPDEICYNVLIDVSVKSNSMKDAKRWFEAMIKFGLSPNVVTYTTLLHAHARAGEVDEAESVWHTMAQSGIEANSVSYIAVITACAKSGDIEKAESWLNKMLAGGLEANIKCYAAVLNVCAKAGNLDRAEHWFNVMVETGIVPNVICYNTVIDACTRAGNAERATWWLDRLCQDSQQKDSGKTPLQSDSSVWLFPTRQSFTAAAHAHALKGDWEACEKTFAGMGKYNIAMDEFSVTVLLTAYSRARPRQRERGEKCFKQYARSGAALRRPPLRALRGLVGWQRLEQIKDELTAD